MDNIPYFEIIIWTVVLATVAAMVWFTRDQGGGSGPGPSGRGGAGGNSSDLV